MPSNCASRGRCPEEGGESVQSVQRTKRRVQIVSAYLCPPALSLLLLELGRERASCFSEEWLSDQGCTAVSGHERFSDN